MSSFSTPYLDVTHDESDQVLVGHWKRGVMPFELQQGYAAILDVAAEKDCRFWLLDIRRRTGVDAADVFWMMEEFFPRLRARLSGTAYLALLMAPHHLAGSLSSMGLPHPAGPAHQPYLVERFTEERTARTWLKHCRQRDSIKK